jgi:hypothetical protein
VRRGGREEFLPLTKSLGVVSGGRLATSVSSPNMEDGSGVVDNGNEEEHRVARSMDELVGMEAAEESRGPGEGHGSRRRRSDSGCWARPSTTDGAGLLALFGLVGLHVWACGCSLPVFRVYRIPG